MYGRLNTFKRLLRISLSNGIWNTFVSAVRFVHWLIRYGIWRFRCLLPFKLSKRSSDSFTAILLSYERPYNISPILQSLLKCEFIEEVIVSNNNPDVDLRSYIKISDKRLNLVQHTERKSCAYRFDLAKNAQCASVICLDDDLFFYPSTLRRLCEEFTVNDNTPLGMTGFRVDWDKTTESHLEVSRFRDEDETVDVLNRCYLFNRRHLTRYFELSRYIQRTDPSLSEDLSLFDDILISASGGTQARVCHSGDYIPCPSGMDAALAVHRRDSFTAVRIRVLKLLRGNDTLFYRD